jgi:hypothetical protein
VIEPDRKRRPVADYQHIHDSKKIIADFRHRPCGITPKASSWRN